MWLLLNKNGLWKMEGETGIEKLRSFPSKTPIPASLIKDNLIVDLDAQDPKIKSVTKIWKKKGVLLERGHGPNPNGFEPGAVSQGITEYELNGIACEAARNYLVTKGIPVQITDSGSALHEIGKLAQGYDVFLSVHHNAFDGSAQGVECLYHNRLGDPADKELAEMVASYLYQTLAYTNRGAKPQALGILSGAESTDVRASVLAECYFMDTPSTAHRDNSMLAGKAIGYAIEAWLKANP
jgi:N-acetylmuramoyl-L-alanine amidase